MGLSIVSHIANKNVNLPILGNVLMRCGDKGLRLLSTNLEIAVSCYVRGKVETPGEFTVPSKLASDYVALLPKERVDILQEGNAIVISCDSYQTRVNGVSATEFPLIPTIERQHGFKVKVNQLRKAISQTLFSVAPNESRPEISGVLFRFASGNSGGMNLTLAATDSYRLAEKTIPLTGSLPSDEPLAVIVPARTVAELTRILSLFKEAVDRPEELEIVIGENQILFSYDTVELISRTIEGRYPDYRQLIPDNFETQVVLSRDDLLRAIKTTSLFSRNGLNDIHLEIGADGKVTLNATNSQTGEHTADLVGKTTGKANKITVNFRYLLDGIGTMETDDVLVQMIDGVSPCLVRPRTSEDSTLADYLYIVMPIRQ